MILGIRFHVFLFDVDWNWPGVFPGCQHGFHFGPLVGVNIAAAAVVGNMIVELGDVDKSLFAGHARKVGFSVDLAQVAIKRGFDLGGDVRAAGDWAMHVQTAISDGVTVTKLRNLQKEL